MDWHRGIPRKGGALMNTKERKFAPKATRPAVQCSKNGPNR